MSVESRLAKLKQEVRGVILSSSKGLTLNQFLKDYKDSIGKPFPYLEFGYDSIPNLLRDIDDVVRLSPGYGGLPSVLVPVTNDKVNHINTMVSKQKQTPNKFISRSVPRRSIQEEPDTKNIRKPVQLPLESKSAKVHHEKHPEKDTLNMPKDSRPFNGYQETPESGGCSNCFEDSRIYKNQNSYEEPSASRYSSNEYQTHLTGNVKDFFDRIGDFKEFKPNISVSDPYHNETNEFSNYSQNSIHNGDYDTMQEEDLDRPPTPGELIITEKMKNHFRDLLADFYPEGIPSSKFCKLYKEKFGVPLHYFNYGVKSFKEMIANVPDVFSYHHQRPPNQDWILYDTSKPLPAAEVQRWIPCDISKNISDLAQHFPGGLKKTEFIVLYRERFNAELDVQRLGFSSLDSFLHSCSDIDYVTIDGEERVMPRDIYQTTSVDIESSYALPPVAEMPYLWGGHFSEDECNPSMSYHPFKLIKSDKLNYAKVYACDVINPSKIWLQMDEHRDDLDKLMFNLNQYYDKYEDNHQLTNNSFAIKDLICTVRFVMDNRWHRAKIVSEGGSSDQVSVLYVDYGTENVVMTSCVRKLRKDFYSLPVQAIQASLYGVMPNPKDDSKWTPECTDFFYNLTIEKKFNIDVEVLNESIPKLEVILHDGKSSLTINDQLLAQGHAVSIGHMPLMESEDIASEINEDEIDNGNYSSMLHESLSIQSNAGDDRRIRTPPGYSSRAVPALASPKTRHSTASSSTCDRIKDLQEDAMNLYKKAERFLEVAKQKCWEANVLEHHVCKHPHVGKEGMAQLSKWLLSQSEPIIAFTLRDNDEESNCSIKQENISSDFKNHSKGLMAPFSQEPGNSFGMRQDSGLHEFNQMQNCLSEISQTPGAESRFNSMTENPPHPHQMVHHQQLPPTHHPPHGSNRLPAMHDQQLPFPSYPQHQQMPPNLMHNKMVGQPLIVKNQPPYMAGRFHFSPYHQQNIIYPQNMGQWGGQWGGPPAMPGHPPMAGPPAMPGPPAMSNPPSMPGPPNVFPYRQVGNSMSENPMIMPVYLSKPAIRSNHHKKYEKASCSPVTFNDNSTNDVPSSQLSQPSPTLPEEHSAEHTTDVDFQPSAPSEKEINTPLSDSHSDSEEPEKEVASSSATPPCLINTSHLSQKQVKKLEKTGDIIVPAPLTNNWSELFPSNHTSRSTSNCATPISSTSADFTYHSLLNAMNDEKTVEEEKLDDAYRKLDDAITERLVQSKVAVNHIMKICVENIHGKSSNMLLLLVGDSVAVLLRQLYLCYWWDEIEGEGQCFDDFMAKLKEIDLPAYSIFYADHISIFDRLREENLIAEDDLYVHVVNLCDVSYILDFVCPIEKHDLSHIKDIFKELSELVLPVDEFWYKNEMSSEQ